MNRRVSGTISPLSTLNSTLYIAYCTMYIHIGKGTVIDEREIIGIFDLDITSQSHITRKYLSAAEKAGQVINAAEDIPKSYVVTEAGGIKKLYLSQMAVSTLLRRAENLNKAGEIFL